MVNCYNIHDYSFIMGLSIFHSRIESSKFSLIVGGKEKKHQVCIYVWVSENGAEELDPKPWFH